MHTPHQIAFSNAGVDPLASQKGFWNDVLGFGDFYYELAVQVAEACLSSRAANGGLVEMSALLGTLRARRSAHAPPISDDDIVRAVGKLKGLGQGFQIVSIGKKTFVQSVPREMTDDYGRIITLAEGTGFVRLGDCVAATGWPEERALENLEELLRQGLCMVDDGDPGGGRLYWFLSLLRDGGVGLGLGAVPRPAAVRGAAGAGTN